MNIELGSPSENHHYCSRDQDRKYKLELSDLLRDFVTSTLVDSTSACFFCSKLWIGPQLFVSQISVKFT
jgi:hypothetical protein